MKYCTYCGAEMFDDAVMCVKCGRMVETSQNTWQAQQPKQSRGELSGLSLVALILMILGTVASGWLLVPLAWCIPMCISYSRKIKNGEYISTGFKICTLIFVNTIAGILMLCDKEH